MEAKIRREQSNLFYSGLAVIVFGVWGSLKNVIYYYLHPEFLEWKNMLEDLPENVDPKLVLILGLVIIALLDFLIRYVIGRGAIRESRRTVSKRKNGYRVLAILYLLFDVFSYAHAVREVFAATSIEKLLASYVREQDVEQTIGIPFLVKIPVLKYLFGTTTSLKERTYIIVTAEANLVHPNGQAPEPVSHEVAAAR